MLHRSSPCVTRSGRRRAVGQPPAQEGMRRRSKARVSTSCSGTSHGRGMGWQRRRLTPSADPLSTSSRPPLATGGSGSTWSQSTSGFQRACTLILGCEDPARTRLGSVPARIMDARCPLMSTSPCRPVEHYGRSALGGTARATPRMAQTTGFVLRSTLCSVPSSQRAARW